MSSKQAECDGSGEVWLGSQPYGIVGESYMPCPGCAKCLKEEESWACDSCGRVARIESPGWIQSPMDDAGVTAEWCPNCSRQTQGA